MNRGFIEDDIRLKLLKHTSASNSHLTQRDLAGYLGIGLGKTHYPRYLSASRRTKEYQQ